VPFPHATARWSHATGCAASAIASPRNSKLSTASCFGAECYEVRFCLPTIYCHGRSRAGRVLSLSIPAVVRWRPMRIRVTVVDTSSSRTLRALLVSDPEVEIVGEDRSGHGVLDTIKHCFPDLMFLGVETAITAMDFVELVKAHEAGILPVTILIGPRRKQSPETLDAQAFGHLEMPTSRDRLIEVLHRAKVYIRSLSLPGRERGLRVLAGSTVYLPKKPDRIVVRSVGRFVFLRADEIEWIEAEGNNVRVHVRNDSYVQRKTISAMERELDPGIFSRIHRSAIVNLDQIQELRPWATGEYIVLMRSGKELTLTRGYRARLHLLLGGNRTIDRIDRDNVSKGN
jgi:two-component system LytT family response regulator